MNHSGKHTVGDSRPQGDPGSWPQGRDSKLPETSILEESSSHYVAGVTRHRCGLPQGHIQGSQELLDLPPKTRTRGHARSHEVASLQSSVTGCPKPPSRLPHRRPLARGEHPPRSPGRTKLASVTSPDLLPPRDPHVGSVRGPRGCAPGPSSSSGQRLGVLEGQHLVSLPVTTVRGGVDRAAAAGEPSRSHARPWC